MAKDVSDVVGQALGRVARETVRTVSSNLRDGARGPLSGGRGLAAGAGLVALAPLATKLVRSAVHDGAGPVKHVVERLSAGRKGADEENGEPAGVGKGGRMPVQQSVDVAVPPETAYSQWTRFEGWPSFMRDLEIVDQQPDERIAWRVTEGLLHTGVVSFHPLADRLTRIELTIDVEPGSVVQRAARGALRVKRAVRGDLHRFKAFVELEQQETGKSSRSRSSSQSSRRSRSGSSGRRNGTSGRSTRSSGSGARSRGGESRRSSRSS